MPVYHCGLPSVDAGGCRVTESVDGAVRIGVTVVFQLDALELSMAMEQASGESHCVNTKEQMSLDLDPEDL